MMKVEIDTENASKEELKHLAAMLHALSGEADRSLSMTGTRSSVTSEPSATKNIFDDPAPSGGLFGMFGDSSPSTPEPVSTVTAPAADPAQDAPSGDLFSIFNSDPSPAPVTGSSVVESYGTVAGVEEEDATPTTAEDIIDDDRIVPY